MNERCTYVARVGVGETSKSSPPVFTVLVFRVFASCSCVTSGLIHTVAVISLVFSREIRREYRSTLRAQYDVNKSTTSFPFTLEHCINVQHSSAATNSHRSQLYVYSRKHPDTSVFTRRKMYAKMEL